MLKIDCGSYQAGAVRASSIAAAICSVFVPKVIEYVRVHCGSPQLVYNGEV